MHVVDPIRFRAMELIPSLHIDFVDFKPELTCACDVYSLGSVILKVYLLETL